MVIIIQFKDSVQKEKAKYKLKDYLYRQDRDPNYIYEICRVNDEGLAEAELKKWQS